MEKILTSQEKEDILVRTPYCLLLTLYFVKMLPSLAHKLKPFITY